MAEPIITIIFEVQAENRDEYRRLIINLRETLRSYSTHDVPALMPPQRIPTRFLDLVLRANGESVRFRLRRDNLYLLGFRIEDEEKVEEHRLWHEFLNSARTYLITGGRTSFLDFGGSYTELARAAHMSTDGISVGSPALSNAITQLATAGSDNETRARSLMTVIVMFPEAIRLNPVLHFVNQNYLVGARMEGNEGSRLMQQIRSWGQFSDALFHMDAYAEERPVVRQWGIRQIVEMVGIALYYCYQGPPRMGTLSDDSNGGGEQCYAGLQLMEVFSVRIMDNNVYVGSQVYGTIAVTDALRTQIIYNRSRDNPEYISEGPYDLLLTGPSEAVSALGDFTIKITLYDKAKDDGVLIDKEINWNFYDFGNEYDNVISKEFTIGQGSVTIKYAVFTNALAAKVKLQKVSADEYQSEVYGNVYSQLSCGGTPSICLFYRAQNDYVEVNNNETIPFWRSVLVVPLSCSTLDLMLQLYDNNTFSDQKLINGVIGFQRKVSGSDVKSIREEHFEALLAVDWVRAY